MDAGGKPVEGGNLLLDADEVVKLIVANPDRRKYLKRVYGASEYIRGDVRYCLWINDELADEANVEASSTHNNVQVADRAQVPGSPFSPNPTRNMLMALMAGKPIAQSIMLSKPYQKLMIPGATPTGTP